MSGITNTIGVAIQSHNLRHTLKSPVIILDLSFLLSNDFPSLDKFIREFNLKSSNNRKLLDDNPSNLKLLLNLF